MVTESHYHSDEPTFEDEIGHSPHVKDVGKKILSCKPPYVLGIHGDWGAGKTSFLKKLCLFLSGNKSGCEHAKRLGEKLWRADYKPSPNIEAIWFDAWRYQFESRPIVALLNEIRAHFTLFSKFSGEAKKLTYAALMSIDELTKKIGISPEKIMEGGEKWEREHFSQPLPSQLFRDLLEDAISKLLGGKGSKKRLVIFVDDLDRCMGTVAFRFLEGMKIYLSISNCVFVLGLDVRHIRNAVAVELRKSGIISDDDKARDPDLYAQDYLNKMFQSVFYLPAVPDLKNLLDGIFDIGVFTDKDPWIQTILDKKLLQQNPRKIKAFVNGLTFYVNQLRAHQKDEQGLDHELVLIFAYLKFMANDIYRILEAEPDFWNILLNFCRTGEDNDHQALKRYTLPEKILDTQETTAPYPSPRYGSRYPDPGEEGLFRVAKLIREFRGGAPPTRNEFSFYMLKGQ